MPNYFTAVKPLDGARDLRDARRVSDEQHDAHRRAWAKQIADGFCDPIEATAKVVIDFCEHVFKAVAALIALSVVMFAVRRDHTSSLWQLEGLLIICLSAYAFAVTARMVHAVIELPVVKTGGAVARVLVAVIVALALWVFANIGSDTFLIAEALISAVHPN